MIVQGLTNIPLASIDALRVTGAYNRQPDVMKNLADGTSWSIREASIRGRLLWEPSPDVAINLIADHDYLYKKGDVSYVVYFDAGLAACRRSCGVWCEGRSVKRRGLCQ